MPNGTKRLEVPYSYLRESPMDTQSIGPPNRTAPKIVMTASIIRGAIALPALPDHNAIATFGVRLGR